MTVTLNLNSDVEMGLIAQADSRGVSLNDFLEEVVTRAAGLSVDAPIRSTARNLSELLLDSPFAGANLNLERSRDFVRPTELE